MRNLFLHNKKRSRWYRITAVSILWVWSVFSLIALASFHYGDPSLIFSSSAPVAIKNLLGWIGSYYASYFIYWAGGLGSYLFFGIVSLVGLMVLRRGLFARQWDRFLGLVVFSLCEMTSAAWCRVDLVPAWLAGGRIGHGIVTRLGSVLGEFLVPVALFAVSWASLVVVYRFAWMWPACIVARLIAFLASERFVRPVSHLVVTVGRGSMRVVYTLYAWTRNTLHGADAHSDSYSVFEFETGRIFEDDASVFKTPVAESAYESDAPSPLGDHQIQQEPRFADPDTAQPAIRRVERQEVTPVGRYTLPPVGLFERRSSVINEGKRKKELQEQAQALEDKLRNFGIDGQVIGIKAGPVITLFEYEPSATSKVSRIIALEDDLSLALQATSIRIIAPIPGTAVVGFEVANKSRSPVYVSGIARGNAFTQSNAALPIILGEDTLGNHLVADLTSMPHLLVAGSTGAGKSVALNAMLVSLLCQRSPEELRLVLIDPKRLEFASYADIPHLLFPVVTQPKRAIPVLKWVVQEMDRRYEMLSEVGVRGMEDYNALEGCEPLPFIVVVIDELADLMITVGKETEDLIARIAQMARAAGIHLIVATQRPSVDVITGVIKVNFPSRISFRVTSKIDSRTILDCAGAEKLLGKGDMLFLDAHGAFVKRVHGAFVSDDEINRVVSHIKRERLPNYLEIPEEASQKSEMLLDGDEGLYDEVVYFLEEVDEVSISLLQRKFRIGFNRSARIIDMLETQGYIMPADGGKTRKVIR